MESQPIYQLKVKLRGFHPPIWRRLLIADNATYFDLHSLIQDAFGWEDYHLHSFRTSPNQGKKRIYIQDPFVNEEWGYPVAEELLPPYKERDEFLDEQETRLNEYLNQEFPAILYEYDFGDSWEHEILLEKILDGSKFNVPAVVAGKHLGPPEDSRGWIQDADAMITAYHNKRSKLWRELVDAYGTEVAKDLAIMCEDFVAIPFSLDEVTITDPKEKHKTYEA